MRTKSSQSTVSSPQKRSSRAAQTPLPVLKSSSMSVDPRDRRRDDTASPDPLRWERYAASRMQNFGQR